jgi:hypothetical protein
MNFYIVSLTLIIGSLLRTITFLGKHHIARFSELLASQVFKGLAIADLNFCILMGASAIIRITSPVPANNKELRLLWKA